MSYADTPRCHYDTPPPCASVTLLLLSLRAIRYVDADAAVAMIAFHITPLHAADATLLRLLRRSAPLLLLRYALIFTLIFTYAHCCRHYADAIISFSSH